MNILVNFVALMIDYTFWEFFDFFEFLSKKCLFGRLEPFGGFGVLGNKSSDPSANFFFLGDMKKKK